MPIYVRINNSTSISKKGAKEAFDFFWVLPHIVKPMKERPAEILGVFIEPIVRDVLARVFPNSFLSIQLRPVGRKVESFHVALVRLEPSGVTQKRPMRVTSKPANEKARDIDSGEGLRSLRQHDQCLERR